MTFARPELQRLVAKHVHPFTSFLRESEILTYSAIQLVCDPSILQPSRWEDCTAGAVGNDAFRNHIVVIGNRIADDFHPSVIGTVPGVVLQANYIESLLDGRYFTPVPFWPAFLVNLALSLGIGWLFYRFSFLGGGSRNLTVLRSFVFIFGGWILSYFLALQLGYYLVIWFPGGALVALWARKRRLKNPEAPKVREAGI